MLPIPVSTTCAHQHFALQFNCWFIKSERKSRLCRTLHEPCKCYHCFVLVHGLLQLLLIRNTLDAMHIERNISANIMKHAFGDNNTPAVRRNMEHVHKFPHLWLRRESNSKNYLQPRAPYVFSASEERNSMALVSATRTPTGYSTTLQRHVGGDRMMGLKSHDHHILLQDMLPATTHHSLGLGPREAIRRMGTLFQAICAKVIPNAGSQEMRDLKTSAAETLCLFEMWFPPGFFDVMSHLVIHVVEELAICGPLHARWYYAIERYMGVLATYVRDKARPEASMASGYAIDEALGFCTEYLAQYEHSSRRIWDANGRAPGFRSGVTGNVQESCPTSIGSGRSS
jgi:hypothetical protein